MNEELGLNWYDFGWRNYDASLGRWMNIDPLAERRYELNPYNYVQNSPMFRFDPNGLTDFKFDKKTGEVTQVGETNDEPDRIVKTNRKGEVKRFKRGKRAGEAKVAIDGIEQGILADGQNFKSESNLIAVGGEGQPTESGVESFALKLSEYVGREIAGASFSLSGDNSTTHIGIGKYENNRHKKSFTDVGGILRTDLAKKDGLNVSNVSALFHTHPGNGRNISNSDRLVPSDPDLDFRDAGLKTNPNLRFFILTRPENFGGKFPKKIDFTKGFSRRLK